ncbi:unnamed protein product [Polarella glacialis]|uniref:Helicase ATP-binding domain-containing protein n=1 Tax=Polarella glacialis TaxID=89957 RepID=A0A813FCD2_POLGL|nr:unnamed protein product [Polarella glacialis]
MMAETAQLLQVRPLLPAHSPSWSFHRAAFVPFVAVQRRGKVLAASPSLLGNLGTVLPGGGGSSSSRCSGIGREARSESRQVVDLLSWVPLGAGLAIAVRNLRRGKRRTAVAASRRGLELSESERTSLSDKSKSSSNQSLWSPSAMATKAEETATGPEEGGPGEYEDDDSWVYWDEQKRPTPGAGGKPRDKVAETMPNPLPSLTPPEPTPSEDGKGFVDQARAFQRAYGQDEPTIMDTDGITLMVPKCPTFEEAVKEFKFPACLHASLARRSFFHTTPVQQCTIPLLLSERDFMASAFTGSGKTAAYLLPILIRLYQVARLVPGTLVASHFKMMPDNKRSDKPMIGRVRGMKRGLAAIEFEEATGVAHRQLVPTDWVVGAPEPPPQRNWEGPAMPRAVILVPTRELAEQVHNEATEFLHYSTLRSVALYGNAGLRSQLRDLAHGCDLLVCTPGRLVDALHKGICKLDQVKFLVLDEVDRMMELGFGSQLEEIVTQGGMPTSAGGRQTSFWSATIPMSVRDLVEAFLGHSCVWVDCTGGQTNPMPSTISHVPVDARPPHRVLRRFVEGDKIVTRKGKRGVVEFPVGGKWRVKFEENGMRAAKQSTLQDLFEMFRLTAYPARWFLMA